MAGSSARTRRCLRSWQKSSMPCRARARKCFVGRPAGAARKRPARSGVPPGNRGPRRVSRSQRQHPRLGPSALRANREARVSGEARAALAHHDLHGVQVSRAWLAARAGSERRVLPAMGEAPAALASVAPQPQVVPRVPLVRRVPGGRRVSLGRPVQLGQQVPLGRRALLGPPGRVVPQPLDARRPVEAIAHDRAPARTVSPAAGGEAGSAPGVRAAGSRPVSARWTPR